MARFSVVWDRPKEVGPWVCERFGGAWDASTKKAIGLERDGVLVAGVMYDNFLGSSICMHVAAEGGYWLTRDFLHAAFTYPFDQLGVHKVIGPVDSSNARARKLDTHLGFVPEAVLTGAAAGGDLILFTMTRQQCRFLKARHG